MLPSSQEVVITLVSGTTLLLFFVIIIIVATVRYQNRKRSHLAEIQRMKNETEKEILRARLEAREEALTLISRELHDNVGQLLSSSKLLLGVASRTVHPPVQELQIAEDTITIAIDELRALGKSLNKDWLEKFDFIENLLAESKRIRATKELEIAVAHPDAIHLPFDQQLILFRIVQEAFQNSLKHGKASKIKIEVRQDKSHVSISIDDNGKGFDVSDESRYGLGINNIKNRTQLLGGAAHWHSSISGTSVVVQIPISMNG